MNPETEKIIKDQMKKLPTEIRELFTNPSIDAKIVNIGKNNGLNVEQLVTLQTETYLVMLGLVHPDDYPSELKDHLNIDDEKVENIVAETNEKILSKITERLREIYEEMDATSENIDINKENPEVDAKLDTRFDKLTPEMKKLLEDSNYQNTLYEISRTYNLNVEQMGEVEKTVVDLITGSIKSEEFANTLKSNLNLPEETTQKIANDINEKVLKVIRQKMKESPTEDEKILKSAGIEIIQPDLTIPELNSGLTKETPALVEKVVTPHPIMVDKLSGPVQNPQVITEHSVENITKAEPAKTYPKGADPYRLPPV
jgi:molybdopterin converting factor small subunit